MAIDIATRQRYFEDKKTKTLIDGIKNSFISAFQNANKELIVSHKDDKSTVTMLEKIGKALVLIYKSIPKQIILPKIFPVKGEVTVDNIVDAKIQNLQDLERYFQMLDKRIGQLITAISSIPQPKIEMPRIEIPKPTPAPSVDFSPIIKELQELRKKISFSKMEIQKPVSMPSIDFSSILEALQELKKALKGIDIPRTVSVDNFPAQLVPHPVTHISINSLRGFIKTTDNTVGTTLTTLPSYGQLLNRRAIIIYNNSANTIYIGGSDITTTTGMPVPASSYSPILDAGYNMIVYGIASQSGNDVRVMEASDEASGK